MIKYIPVLEFFFFLFSLWMNPVGMPKYTLTSSDPNLALVGLHCTLSWELLVLDILIRAYISLHQFIQSIRKTAFWTCISLPVSVLNLNFEWIAFRPTQSRAHKDVLCPSAPLNFSTSWGIVMREHRVFRQTLTVVACALIYRR